MENKNPTDYGLGRVPSIDFRDRKFMARIPKRVPAARTNRAWITAKPLDQGSTPQCVAYAWEQYLLSAPIKNKFYKNSASLYHEAQLVDEWEGENYDGTSVRAGAKVLQAAGYLTEYRWAFDIDSVVDFILTTGPMVLGTVWDTSMFFPFQTSKRDTFIRRGGRIEGGHAYMAKGVNKLKPCFCGRPGAVRIMNSWGPDWGDGGKAWVCLYEMAELLEDYGEAAMASEIRFKVQT